VTDIPSHLVGWTVPEVIPTDGFIFQVRLRCPCGSGRFWLLHPGGVQYSWQPPKRERLVGYPTGAILGGRTFFLIQAVCAECAGSWLLFDIDFHGRTAIVSRNPEQQAAPRPPLTPWGCVQCGGEEHAAVARYTLHCPEDFDVDIRPKCPDAQREDAFVWFGVDIECCRCGSFTWLWVECEML